MSVGLVSGNSNHQNLVALIKLKKGHLFERMFCVKTGHRCASWKEILCVVYGLAYQISQVSSLIRGASVVGFSHQSNKAWLECS